MENKAKGLSFLKLLSPSMLGVPFILVIILSMLILPLPPFLLDIFFTFNIALALIVILSSIYISKPLDMGAFPTIILITTLLRLALNIASTRVVLLDGHEGTGAAGKVIEAFGDFIVGGNYTVGFIVFAILVIINFVVITKGAGRISEVTARFTLDSMPGKQMAIDADLNAGVIDQEEAKARRAEVVAEADFYGSMDGASKFVRGDAVAGILILFINLIGGLIIGVVQHDMSIADAGRIYSLLTIGDGLVAQIPALLLSISAAIIVTRVSSEQNMGQQITDQLFSNPRALVITAAILGSLGVVPGMPNGIFISMALILGVMAYMKRSSKTPSTGESADEVNVDAPTDPDSQPKDLGWDDISAIDMIGLEVGYRLIPLVDQNQHGELMPRIKGVRKKLTQDLGFLIPAVHIRDNLELSPTTYRILLLGVTVGEAEIMPEKELAINSGGVVNELPGIVVKDPAFGMDALWIDPAQKDHAESLGYTVVDPCTVIATHLNQLLKKHANELLGREEVQSLMDRLTETAPKLVAGLVPDIIQLSTLQKVLRSLLEEGVPIRDMRTILETLAVEAPMCQDPVVLTDLVRTSLGRLIVQNINGLADDLAVAVLDPNLEHLLQETKGEGRSIVIEPGLAERLHRSLTEAMQQMQAKGSEPILLVTQGLRSMMASFVRNTLPDMHVLAYSEVPSNKKVNIVSSIGQE